MFSIIFKRMFILGIPAAILIATWLLIPQLATLSQTRLEILEMSPYLITLAGMFLAIHFHRGRPFMVLLLLIIFFWVSRSTLVGKTLELSLNVFYQAFVLLIPINIALITVMRERGVFTSIGRIRFVFLAVEAIVAFWLFRYNFIDLLPYIARSYHYLSFFNDMLVPQLALMGGVCCFVLVALLTLRRQNPIESGMLGALTAFFIASNWLNNSHIHVAFCSAGAAIITLSVLRDSYNMAFCDDLTGLHSRRSLNESLNGLGRSYTVAMLDVDHFKKFNDTYGHDVGDQVLKMVAREIRDVSGGGKPYRYGGEEFTILFPGRRAEETIPHLEELRKGIANYQLALRNSDRPKSKQKGSERRGSQRNAEHVSVTISIGVAERSETLTSTAEVMKAADKALYKAKNMGRNQVALIG